MRPRSLHILGVVAAAAMVVGTVVAAVFAVEQSQCDSGFAPGVSVHIPNSPHCSAYGITAAAGVGLLALGAALIGVIGFLSAIGANRARREAAQGADAEVAEVGAAGPDPAAAEDADQPGPDTTDDPPSGDSEPTPAADDPEGEAPAAGEEPGGGPPSGQPPEGQSTA